MRSLAIYRVIDDNLPHVLRRRSQALRRERIRMKTQDLSIDRREYLIRDFEQGFIRHCGFRVQALERGSLIAIVQIRPEHRQQDGFIHAGVMATLADHSAGYAAYSLVSDEFRILTIEFKINFLDPAFGEQLTCRAHILREGRRILVAESDVFDVRSGREHMVAKALVTLAAVSSDRVPRPPSARLRP